MSINTGKLANQKVTNTVHYINGMNRALTPDEKFKLQKITTNNNLLITINGLPDYTITIQSIKQITVSNDNTGNKTTVSGTSFNNTVNKSIKWILNN